MKVIEVIPNATSKTKPTNKMKHYSYTYKTESIILSSWREIFKDSFLFSDITSSFSVCFEIDCDLFGILGTLNALELLMRSRTIRKR